MDLFMMNSELKVLKMAAPCALVTSCCSVNPSHIIKRCSCPLQRSAVVQLIAEEEILDRDDLPDAVPVTDGIVGYPWRIENKYYTAEVQLCSSPSKTIGDADFSERLEAVVVVFDDTNESFESVKQWMPFIEQLSPSTQILACKQFTLNGDLSRHTAQLWCLDNSFELVELERGEDEDEGEDEKDEYDITGVKRIISALHAHSWSNLELKESRGGLFGLLQSELLNANRLQADGCSGPQTDADDSAEPPTVGSHMQQPTTDTATAVPGGRLTGSESESTDALPATSTNGGEADHSPEGGHVRAGADASAGGQEREENGRAAAPAEEGTASTQDRIDNLLNDDMELFRALGSDDPGGESFEGLFTRMATMKERAAALSGEERKKYAEKVAVSFWKALGGDEEEVHGLEDSD